MPLNRYRRGRRQVSWYNRLSIRTQIFLLALAIVLPVEGILAWYLAADVRSAREDAYAQVSIFANSAAAELERYLRQTEAALERLAVRPLVKALDPRKCDPIFKEYVRLNPYFTTLATRDLHANPVCSFIPRPPGASQVEKFPWFIEGVRNEKFTVGDAFFGVAARRWVSVLTYPIRNDDRVLTGLLVLPIDLQKLSGQLLASVPKNAVVTVLDRNKTILLRSVLGELYIGKPAQTNLNETVLDNLQGAYFRTGIDGVNRLYALAAIPGIGWTVSAGLPEAEVLADYHAALQRSLGIGLGVLLLALALAWRISRAIVKPIVGLADTSARIASGDSLARADVSGPLEVEFVAQQFNLMLEALERNEATLARTSELLHRTGELAKVGGWQLDLRSQELFWSQETCRIHEVEYPATSTLEQAINYYFPEYRPIFRAAVQAGIDNGASWDNLELRLTTAGGRAIWVRTQGSAVIQNGKTVQLFGAIQDITKQKEAEGLIWKQANFDPLTGLPNRRMFHDRLGLEIKKSHRAGLPLALLFVDLDRFKEVNDTLGHTMGDKLLMEAAVRIAACVRESDTVARQGGDEFTVILGEVEDNGIIERVAQAVIQALSQPFQVANEVIYISASIGIALYPNDAANIEQLLKNADLAMYAAKNAGRSRFSYFTDEMQAAAQKRLRMVGDLRGTLAGGQFRLYFQPIVELASGRIMKAEALLRWLHPKKGMIGPAEFIPLAEETGLIVEIGDWVFKESARQARRWRDLYGAEFQMGVNMSPVQFQAASEQDAWLEYLLEQDLSGRNMVIEITEGLLLDADSGVATQLLQFKNAGMQVAIDDFGTGYSALSYLNKFDLDFLKIDQSFVRNLARDSSDLALSEAIIVMAHKLGLKVVAEGVETAEQRDLLIAAGCDYAQGYLYSRPVPAREFEKLLGV
ncbi:MAG: EAL domain-containing protein [Betaproteobacteria bacterium]|nr:EAL domain-containing protein [Betaproteobacteria bacterium]